MSPFVYSPSDIQADVNFVRSEMQNCKTKPRPGSGLDDVLDSAQAGLLLRQHDEALRRKLHALNTLAGALKQLKAKGIVYCHQLNKMRRGSFEYGVADREERWYKDFEFELFSASQMCARLDNISLPQNDDGNDIFYADIEIQCKHPDSNDVQRRQSEIQKFNDSLKLQGKYGVFGIAIEDMASFGEGSLQLSGHEGFTKFLTRKRDEAEAYLSALFFPFIRGEERILGIYVTSTYYGWISPEDIQMRLKRDANAVLLQRSGVDEEATARVKELLSVFNPAYRVIDCDKQ